MFTKPKGMLTTLSSESYFFWENARCFRPFSDTFWMNGLHMISERDIPMNIDLCWADFALQNLSRVQRLHHGKSSWICTYFSDLQSFTQALDATTIPVSHIKVSNESPDCFQFASWSYVVCKTADENSSTEFLLPVLEPRRSTEPALTVVYISECPAVNGRSLVGCYPTSLYLFISDVLIINELILKYKTSV